MATRQFTKKQILERKDALSRARRIRTRWVKAARDGGTHIQEGEKKLLVRLIALEILNARGVTAFTLADLP